MDEKIRVIQYLGSKLRIIDKIKNEIHQVTKPGGMVVDLFSGSGVVTRALAKDYTVIANDVQKYSSLITKVLIKKLPHNTRSVDYTDLIDSEAYVNNKKVLTKIFEQPLAYEKSVLENEDYEGLAELCECGVFYDGKNIEEKKYPYVREVFGESLNLFNRDTIVDLRKSRDEYMLFSLYYSNSYFSLEQCIEIDSIRCAIDKINTNKLEDDLEKSLLLVCLMHAVSEIVSSVGKNFAQPIKVTDSKGNIKRFAIKRCMRDRNMRIETPFRTMYTTLLNKNAIFSEENQVFSRDALEVLGENIMEAADTFYLDPPYTIDHYSRFYHVLETLVEYDYPVLEEKKFHGKYYLMNGRYRNDRFQSNYCIPSKGYKELDALIEKIHSLKANIVLSYSDSNEEHDTRKRVISKDELIEITKKFYTDVEIKNLNHRYRKLSGKESNRKEINDGELLIVCRYR